MKFSIFVTQRCNLRCKYCYEHGNVASGDMSKKIADKTIDFIMRKIVSYDENMPLSIIFHGGEPLMNFDLIKYITSKLEYLVKDRKIIYSMTTNATLLNDEIISFISNKIDNISVSIDGTRESNNYNRVFENGEGSYDIVIENLCRLYKTNKNIRIRMTFTPDTVSCIYKGVHNLVSRGFDNIVVAMDFQNNEWNRNHICIIEDEIRKLIELNSKYPDLYINLTDLCSMNTERGHCFGGISSFAIGSNGDIYPCIICVGKKKYGIGNVFNEFVDENRIDEIYDLNYLDNKVCDTCSRQKYCVTNRCKLINDVVRGSFDYRIPIMCVLEDVNLNISKLLLNEMV